MLQGFRESVSIPNELIFGSVKQFLELNSFLGKPSPAIKVR